MRESSRKRLTGGSLREAAPTHAHPVGSCAGATHPVPYVTPTLYQNGVDERGRGRRKRCSAVVVCLRSVPSACSLSQLPLSRKQAARPIARKREGARGVHPTSGRPTIPRQSFSYDTRGLGWDGRSAFAVDLSRPLNSLYFSKSFKRSSAS